MSDSSRAGPRDEAERVADRLREELLLTLREIDRRRHQAFDLQAQLAMHRQQLMTAGGVIAGGLGLLLGAVAWRVHHNHQPEVQRRRRVEGLRRAWRHPERLARKKKQHSLAAQALNKVALTLAVTFGVQLAKASAARLLPTTAEQRAQQLSRPLLH
jgi:hypothetical protein